MVCPHYSSIFYAVSTYFLSNSTTKMIKMNVFQCCLKALETEKLLCDLTVRENTNANDTTTTQDRRQTTILLSDMLRQTAEVYATSTEDERCRAFPFVLSAVMKPLARVIESNNSVSLTPATITASLSQLSVSAVSTLVSVLQSLLSFPVSGKALFFQHSATIERLVCMVTLRCQCNHHIMLLTHYITTSYYPYLSLPPPCLHSIRLACCWISAKTV